MRCNCQVADSSLYYLIIGNIYIYKSVLSKSPSQRKVQFRKITAIVEVNRDCCHLQGLSGYSVHPARTPINQASIILLTKHMLNVTYPSHVRPKQVYIQDYCLITPDSIQCFSAMSSQEYAQLFLSAALAHVWRQLQGGVKSASQPVSANQAEGSS